jgi:hypothetical protein
VKRSQRFSAPAAVNPVRLRGLGLLALIWLLALTASAQAGEKPSAREVDLELVLAVDVSSSMDHEE